jgi:hypothetical protein
VLVDITSLPAYPSILTKALVSPGKKKSGATATSCCFCLEVFTATNFFTDTFLDRFVVYRWLADWEGAWLLKASCWFLEV